MYRNGLGVAGTPGGALPAGVNTNDVLVWDGTNWIPQLFANAHIVQDADISAGAAKAQMGVLTLTLTANAGDLFYCWFDATVKNLSVLAAAIDLFDIRLDGALIVGTNRAFPTNLNQGPIGIAIHAVTPPLTVGAHTIAVFWQESAVAGTDLVCRPVAQSNIEGAQLSVEAVR